MSQPSPADRLLERLQHLPPDACRAILAAFDQQGQRGGGYVWIEFEVSRTGSVDACQVTQRYSRSA